MTLKPKGGRGYKAPYETHQVRVPDPLIPQVHQLIERYQECIANGGNPNDPPQLLDQSKEQVEQLERKLKAVDKFKVEASKILHEALKLKANAGGAIKKEIEKVLLFLEPHR